MARRREQENGRQENGTELMGSMQSHTLQDGVWASEIVKVKPHLVGRVHDMLRT